MFTFCNKTHDLVHPRHAVVSVGDSVDAAYGGVHLVADDAVLLLFHALTTVVDLRVVAVRLTFVTERLAVRGADGVVDEVANAVRVAAVLLPLTGTGSVTQLALERRMHAFIYTYI